MSDALLTTLRNVQNEHDVASVYTQSGYIHDEYDPELVQILKAFIETDERVRFAEKVYSIYVTIFDREIIGSKEKVNNLSNDLFDILISNNEENINGVLDRLSTKYR